MDNVWQDSIVSPNSLQRSIAQLRKALGDDSKKQCIIKTHAKQGYSLERKVEWQPSKSSEQHKSTIKPTVSRNSAVLTMSKSFALLITIVLISVLGFTNLSPEPEGLAFDQLTPVTSSDEKEGNASYSPDGRYIVFQRYTSLCEKNLWAKDLITQKEHQSNPEQHKFKIRQQKQEHEQT